MPTWLLITESVLLGLPIAAGLPLFALVPMIFGVTEETPPGPARRVYLLLVAFPLVVIGALFAAFRTEPDNPLRWVFALVPIAHLVGLFLFRVKN